MKRIASLFRAASEQRWGFTGLLGLALLWWICLNALAIDPTSHDLQDSYTLQALAWRAGLLHLPADVPHLELAVYHGQYYVSFPPVPTLPLWLLTFIYGELTPNHLVNLCYFLSSYLVGYSLCRRLGKGDLSSAVFAAFLVAGCNLLNMCWFGGVWYQAQALSFLLTLCAFRLLLGKTPIAWGAGLTALALSVGCRPFQAVYALPALFMAYQNFREQKEKKPVRALFAMLPLLIAPVLIGIAYGAYNMARFGSFFEFGHTYLPEFQTYGTQFSLAYVPDNFLNIFRLPYMNAGRLDFFRFDGFAFYLSNPLFLLGAAALVYGLFKRRLRWLDGALVLSLLVHFFLLLLHRTFGGWQFGARYLIDLCPALFLLTLRHPIKPGPLTGLLMIWGVAFNIYGGLMLYFA